MCAAVGVIGTAVDSGAGLVSEGDFSGGIGH
jgi:hypothetical protein